ncbi:L,D-transpeptidase [Oenococcus sp. UCMA 16435]|nr:L,D-transpeptidase [Oenococcus sp. UCMA 16435]MDI4584267.1 L,D-transpeptidase family protein [Oenococcus sp. UCMA 14587]
MLKKQRKKIFIYLFLFLALSFAVGYKTNQEYSKNRLSLLKSKDKKSKDKKKKTSADSKMRTVNWRKSSEKVSYPILSKYRNVWIDVSIARQRVYIKSGSRILYEMYCSTGIDNSTPTGTYKIQKERGTFFYNVASKEGAHYWVSWKDNGVYLFHTVPTDKNGKYVVSQAKELGKKPGSHGCIRLSIPDAKWIYKNISEGTKVVVHGTFKA